MKKLIVFLFIPLFFFSCKPVIVNHEVKNATHADLELGNIGLPGRSLLEYKFRTTAIPQYQNKIRIKAQATNFNKSKFNTYLKASPDNKLGLVYIDSLENKPQFTELRIIDKTGYIHAINNDPGVLNYLKNQQDIKAITSLSVAFNNNQVQTITNAESVFLTYSYDLKKSYLETIDKNGGVTNIYFGESVPFAYSVSGFCWQENTDKQIVVADVIDSWDSCPSGTYQKASKAKKEEKEINYFKL